MKLSKYLLILITFFVLSCDKDSNEFFAVSFKLDNKAYNYTAGHAEYEHDYFDYTELEGISIENNSVVSSIRIDFKENSTTRINMVEDTVTVFVVVDENNAYVASNWPPGRLFTNYGKSFEMNITYRDDEKICGEFSGILWGFPDINEFEEVELKDGKFELFFK